jgi:hypothetical protein
MAGGTATHGMRPQQSVLLGSHSCPWATQQWGLLVRLSPQLDSPQHSVSPTVQLSPIAVQSSVQKSQWQLSVPSQVSSGRQHGLPSVPQSKSMKSRMMLSPTH